jgi:hypothetical protein
LNIALPAYLGQVRWEYFTQDDKGETRVIGRILTAGIATAMVVGVMIGGFTVIDRIEAHQVVTVSAEQVMGAGMLLPDRRYGPYSPPVKKRFGRGKPSTPKHPL